MNLSALVDQFFVEKDGRFVVNNQFSVEKDGKTVLLSNLSLFFESVEEKTQFLVEVLRTWAPKIPYVFCTSSALPEDFPEEEWRFFYKTPSTCYGCVSGQNILNRIFGGCEAFNALPFVHYGGDRDYSFSFMDLKFFAENGSAKTYDMMLERRREEQQKQAKAAAEEERKANEAKNLKLAECLGDREISPELRKQLQPYADKKITIASSEIAVVISQRNLPSTAGIGCYDQLHVLYNNQSKMEEWLWRDPYSAKNDRWDLRIYGIKNVEVSSSKNKISVKIEILNEKYGNRTVTFDFDKPKTTVVNPTISADDQTTFIAKVEEEIFKVMTELNRLWGLKSNNFMANYPTATGYIPYHKPSVKQREIHPELGVAAFVTEDQMDAHLSFPQIRYQLWVITQTGETKRLEECHSYIGEGPDISLSIVELKAHSIKIDINNNKKTLSIK